MFMRMAGLSAMERESMLLGELRRFITDNSEPGQCLEFRDRTPGQYVDYSTYFVSPERRYAISAGRWGFFHRKAELRFREDDRGGSPVTRESLLAFIDGMFRSGYSQRQDAGIVRYSESEPGAGLRYLVSPWSEIEAESPGVFFMKHPDDAAPLPVRIDEALSESAGRGS